MLRSSGNHVAASCGHGNDVKRTDSAAERRGNVLISAYGARRGQCERTSNGAAALTAGQDTRAGLSTPSTERQEEHPSVSPDWNHNADGATTTVVHRGTLLIQSAEYTTTTNLHL